MNLGKIIAKCKKKLLYLVKLPGNLFDSEDISFLKQFIPEIVMYGIMVNFALMVMIGVPFNWYSWLGWGFAYKLIDKKIVNWIRSIIHKK